MLNLSGADDDDDDVDEEGRRGREKESRRATDKLRLWSLSLAQHTKASLRDLPLSLSICRSATTWADPKLGVLPCRRHRCAYCTPTWVSFCCSCTSFSHFATHLYLPCDFLFIQKAQQFSYTIYHTNHIYLPIWLLALAKLGVCSNSMGRIHELSALSHPIFFILFFFRLSLLSCLLFSWLSALKVVGMCVASHDCYMTAQSWRHYRRLER